ncbi:hypothetical protein ILUMI_12308, partial [Ignelater luminosus]
NKSRQLNGPRKKDNSHSVTPNKGMGIKASVWINKRDLAETLRRPVNCTFAKNMRKKSTNDILMALPKNISISKRTLRFRLKEANLLGRRPTIKQKLIPAMIKKRKL